MSGGTEARQQVAQQIADACTSIGFFYVINHTVPLDLVARTFAESKRFFERPLAEKMRSAATLEHWRGFIPPRVVNEGAVLGGSMEIYRLMLDLPEDDPDVLAGVPLHEPNRWPSDLPGFQAVVSAYFDSCLEFAGHLRRAFSLALGQKEDFFEPYYHKPMIGFGLHHYRPAASLAEEDFEVGVGAHQDTGAFTLLMQDDVGGLEVQNRKGSWIGAPHIPGAYLINIGNVMMAWTNGLFLSTPHRVVNRSLRDRYSIPMFMNPDYSVVVQPLEPFVSAENPSHYEPVHYGEFMTAFFDKGQAYLKTG
jgi:isopenicillin N synthase-like dioxygenase